MRFLLEDETIMYDQQIPAGTIIGDDTSYPIYPGWVPGSYMKPLDAEAKALSEKTGKDKPNWGRPPEENLPTTVFGDNHAIYGSGINRSNQPIIPPPLEHLTSPNDRKPSDGMTAQPSPVIRDMVLKENERIAADNDKKMAEQSNAESDKRSKANLPSGVTVENSGAQAKAKETAPGQGPAPRTTDAPGQGFRLPSGQKPLDMTSTQVSKK